MAQIRQLAKAPIVEALIDFRVAARDGVTARSIDDAVQESPFGYYKKGPILRSLVEFQTTADPSARPHPASSTTTIIGSRLHSTDEQYVAQFSTEGFTLSRLEPYENWAKLVSEAKRVWPFYLRAIGPTLATRVATRFINNLRLPLRTGESFARFLNQQPSFPSELPQGMSGFLQRFMMHDARTEARIIVTYALEEFEPGDSIPVIVDLDASRDVRISTGSPELWQSLDDLRALKNQFFFASLTDEAVALYQ